MRPLIVLSARFTAWLAAVVVGVGVFGGVVRLLPWFVAPAVPWKLTLPFARALVAPMLEATILVALPLGATLGACTFVERGEARALLSLGARPFQLVVAFLRPGLLVVLLSAAAAVADGAEPPGRFAARLIETGRASCGADGRRRIDIPLLSVSWLCLADRPWLAGRIPGVSAPLWFSASALVPSDDFESVELRGAHLAGQLGRSGVRLRAGTVRISGLSGWGGARRSLSGLLRAALVSASAVVSSIALSWLVIRRRGRVSLPTFAVVAAGAAAAMLSALHAVDQRSLGAAAYAVIPGVGLVAAAAGSAFMSLRWRVAGRRVR